MMQLDDVVHVSTRGPRVEEAMYRSIRWLDRCIKANKRINQQNIFPVIQGGLDLTLRKKCIEGNLWTNNVIIKTNRPHPSCIAPKIREYHC